MALYLRPRRSLEGEGTQRPHDSAEEGGTQRPQGRRPEDRPKEERTQEPERRGLGLVSPRLDWRGRDRSDRFSQTCKGWDPLVTAARDPTMPSQRKKPEERGVGYLGTQIWVPSDLPHTHSLVFSRSLAREGSPRTPER